MKKGKHMKILYVDDSESHRVLMPALFTGGDAPWLRRVTIVAVDKMPPVIEVLRGYDGLILDERLGNQRGHELAQELHAKDWQFPVMILTAAPELLPVDVLNYVDAVAVKSVGAQRFSALDPLYVSRGWIRNIARVRAAALPDGADT